jgi:hypothetical protein
MLNLYPKLGLRNFMAISCTETLVTLNIPGQTVFRLAIAGGLICCCKCGLASGRSALRVTLTCFPFQT